MSARQLPRLVALASAAALAGCGRSPLGLPHAASTQAGHTAGLFRGMVIAALVVGGLVWGLIAWSLIRYRSGRFADDIGSQRSYNIPIEVVYTALPVVIVAVLFFFSLHTERQVTKLSAHPDVRVDVIGFQWQWQFRYPTADVTVTGASAGEPPELVLPVGQTTELHLITRDVNHAFWVPRFLSKRDLIPGVRNVIDVTPTTTGTFAGRCAEFCGLDHWRMNFTVRVVSAADYRSWLAAQAKGTP